jgi:hypothetical protein
MTVLSPSRPPTTLHGDARVVGAALGRPSDVRFLDGGLDA